MIRCSGNPAWASTSAGKSTSGAASVAPSKAPMPSTSPPRPTTPMPCCCCVRKWPTPTLPCVPPKRGWRSHKRTPSARRVAWRSPSGCSATVKMTNSTGSRRVLNTWRPRPPFPSSRTSSMPCATYCARCSAARPGRCRSWRPAMANCPCQTGQCCRMYRPACCSAARTSVPPSRQWRRSRRWSGWPRPIFIHS
ncbi:hypothetical protein D3C80_1241220 [compost metagenome]